jgi:ABC-type sugar transport systems, permease components
MKTLFSGRSDMPFAMLLLAPSLILLGGLVAWPMISNIEISFLRLPLNPRIDAVFVGLDNYIRILGDAAFWHSLWMTFWYTALVVIGSTGLGLAVAIFFNREFRMRKTARSLADTVLCDAVYFTGICLEIHVQQRLRNCELSGR